MPYNLLREAWLPVRTRAAGVRWISPPEIVGDGDADHQPIAPAWPRADWDVATYEFLIGLVYAACPATSVRDWGEQFHQPPSRDALRATFDRHDAAFFLDGDGPRFLQDLEPFEIDAGAPTPIERLTIDAAGENALKKNQDLFAHRGRYAQIDRPTAAIMLYALQQFAPSGGAGNRTSMRGGGPMTALALPPGEEGGAPSLWRRIWANTPFVGGDEGPPIDDADARAFPWMAPTLTSESKRIVTAAPGGGAHATQAFFGMPRRLRLVFDGAAVIGFHQKPYGVNYGPWRHPLTPYYEKPGQAPLPSHPKSGRFGYRDWVAAVIGETEATQRLPAKAIHHFRTERRRQVKGRARTLIAGWAMSNMEPLDFIYAEQPLHVSADPDQAQALDETAAAMAKAGEQAWSLCRSALTKGPGMGDKTALEALRVSFFDQTEENFHEALRGLAASETTAEAAKKNWLDHLRRSALELYDGVATPGLPAASTSLQEQIVKQRVILAGAFSGRGRRAPLHETLTLPPPEPRKREPA